MTYIASAGSPSWMYISSGLRVISSAWLINQAIWSSGKSAKSGTWRSSEASTILLYLAQVLVDELYCYGTLPDSGGHALHRTVANVTYGEDAGHVGFKQKGIAFQRPSLRPCSLPQKIRAGQD